MSPEEKIAKAVEIAWRVGNTDGAHHKQWGLDQILRVLLGDEYEKAAANHEAGFWDTGIPP